MAKDKAGKSNGSNRRRNPSNGKAAGDPDKDKASLDLNNFKAAADPNKDKAAAIKAAKDKAAVLLRQLDAIATFGGLTVNELSDLQNDLTKVTSSIARVTKKPVGILKNGSNGDSRDYKTLYLESVNERLNDKLIEVLLEK
jgi:hypothetical protein